MSENLKTFNTSIAYEINSANLASCRTCNNICFKSSLYIISSFFYQLTVGKLFKFTHSKVLKRTAFRFKIIFITSV